MNGQKISPSVLRPTVSFSLWRLRVLQVAGLQIDPKGENTSFIHSSDALRCRRRFLSGDETSLTATMTVIPDLLLLLGLFVSAASAFSLSSQPVSKLLEQHADRVSLLKSETQKIVGSTDAEPYCNDVFYLRYCLDDSKGDDEQVALLKENLAWRTTGSGKSICDAAQSALQKATADGGWNNDPVRDAAPHASIINNFITSSQCLTTSTSKGDLIYCIRAGKIDDKGLMSSLGDVAKMVDFFLYCKEINASVANSRSLSQDRLVCVLAANDLAGVKLVGGDASFRSALSDASKQANKLYPTLSGPTLLLNLPPLLGALVKLFTPLFPPEVRKRIKFAQGVLEKKRDLMDISGGPARQNL